MFGERVSAIYVRHLNKYSRWMNTSELWFDPVCVHVRIQLVLRGAHGVGVQTSSVLKLPVPDNFLLVVIDVPKGYSIVQ